MSLGRRIVIGSILTFLAACSSTPQSKQGNRGSSDQSPTQVAQAELQSIQKESNWTLLGLGSVENAHNATLGKPLRVYFAKANELGNYSGGDLSSILHETDSLVFPVLVDGKGRLLIEIRKQGNTWRAIRDGYQDSATSLVTAENVSTVETGPTASIFIRLPSMNESNLLLTGRVPSPAPGGPSDSVPMPDLNNVIQVVQLNGKPVVSNQTDHQGGVTGIIGNVDSIVRFDRSFGSKTSNHGPGAAPVNPARDFFKAMAPAAKQAAAQSERGPA